MFSYFANPARFEKLRRFLQPLFLWASVPLLAFGLWDSLVASPPDYQQGEAMRIMYIHVPSAWLALFLYASLGVAGFTFVVFKHTLAGLYIRAATLVGLVATAVCLVTGALWGQPMWGTWWVWDARLTSVLILFFQYVGLLILLDAFERSEQGEQAAAWLAMLGTINIPVIKYSVEWWATLHQPSTISSFKRMANPALDGSMMRPLLVMALGLFFMCGGLVLMRLRTEILNHKHKT